MAIKKTKKAPKPKSPRAPRADDPGKRRCETCGHERKLVEFKYVVTSLLDPALYFCTFECYSPWWTEEKKRKMSPPVASS